MNKVRAFYLLRVLAVMLVSVSLSACSTKHFGRYTNVDAAKERPVAVVHINDVYRIEGLSNGQLGGLARVRALRKELEQLGRDVLFLHGGDLLYPSPMSDEFNGLQMISLLSFMDGDAKKFDHKMFAAFGNHEFDKSLQTQVNILEKAVEQSQFTWLAANIDFIGSEQLQNAKNIKSNALINIGGLNVGIFGITTDMKTPEFATIDDNYTEIARAQTAFLRNNGADLVIGLTHLTLEQDRQILGLNEDGPDVIFGGHEHHKILDRINGRYIVKADADAVSAAVATIEVGAEEPVVDVDFALLDEKQPKEPLADGLVNTWETKFEKRYCERQRQAVGCLNKVLAVTPFELVGEESQIRRFETNLGSWLADLALRAFSTADVAFINSGGLRLNENIPANSAFKQKHLNALFPYNSSLVLLEITGAQLQKVIDRSVQGWSANGWWLQIAGFAFKHNPQTQSASELTLLTPNGPKKVLPEMKIRAVVSKYLIDPRFDQDGYVFLNASQIIKDLSNDIELKFLVQKAFAESANFLSKPEGRICNQNEKSKCLLN